MTAQVDELITEPHSAVSCNKIGSLLPSQLKKTRGKGDGRERAERDMCVMDGRKLVFHKPNTSL